MRARRARIAECSVTHDINARTPSPPLSPAQRARA